MNKAKLILLACPALLASMVLVVNSANATEAVTQPPDTSVLPVTPIVEIVFEQEGSEEPILEFTDQESDDAIARYGCDCPRHLNAIRQLQGKLPLL